MNKLNKNAALKKWFHVAKYWTYDLRGTSNICFSTMARITGEVLVIQAYRISFVLCLLGAAESCKYPLS